MKKSIENFLSLIANSKNDVVMHDFLSGVSKSSISYIERTATLSHTLKVLKGHMGPEEFTATLRDIQMNRDIALNALISNIKAVNRLLVTYNSPVLCDTESIEEVKEFAITLVDCYVAMA